MKNLESAIIEAVRMTKKILKLRVRYEISIKKIEKYFSLLGLKGYSEANISRRLKRFEEYPNEDDFKIFHAFSMTTVENHIKYLKPIFQYLNDLDSKIHFQLPDDTSGLIFEKLYILFYNDAEFKFRPHIQYSHLTNVDGHLTLYLGPYTHTGKVLRNNNDALEMEFKIQSADYSSKNPFILNVYARITLKSKMYPSIIRWENGERTVVSQGFISMDNFAYELDNDSISNQIKEVISDSLHLSETNGGTLDDFSRPGNLDDWLMHHYPMKFDNPKLQWLNDAHGPYKLHKLQSIVLKKGIRVTKS